MTMTDVAKLEEGSANEQQTREGPDRAVPWRCVFAAAGTLAFLGALVTEKPFLVVGGITMAVFILGSAVGTVRSCDPSRCSSCADTLREVASTYKSGAGMVRLALAILIGLGVGSLEYWYF